LYKGTPGGSACGAGNARLKSRRRPVQGAQKAVTAVGRLAGTVRPGSRVHEQAALRTHIPPPPAFP